MKKGQKRTLLVAVLLLLVGVTAYFGASTYAKYVSEITGNKAEVKVAKWDFVDDNETQEFEIELANAVDESTLVEDRIAPGTSGSFKIVLNNKDTETGVDFTVTLDSITNKPTNLKFYRNNDFTGEVVPGTTQITGQLEANDATDLEIPIYWQWAYETAEIATNDPVDTADGVAANELTVGVTIKGVQTAPSATAISTHVNNN